MSNHRARKLPSFPVPTELAKLRELALASFASGDLETWSRTCVELKQALEARRGELLTPERKRDIRVNAWEENCERTSKWREAAE